MRQCIYMDEVRATHTGTEHEPHQATPTGDRVPWEDGDETRLGYDCAICHHVADYGDGPRLYHTDPRLDKRRTT